MAKYYCILFDADNTLLNFDAAESKALAETLVNYGIEPDAETVQTYRTINEELWRQLEKGQIKREKLMAERFTRFLKAIDAAGDGAEMNRFYLEQLSTHPDLMGPEVLDVLRELSEVATLAVVTNGFQKVQTRRLAESGILNFMEDVFVSEKMDAEKPNRKIFDAALRALGVENREHVLMVGDGLTNSLWHLSFLTLTCGVVALGVVNGIERLSKYLLPTLFILMIVIMIRSLSLPGAMEGVKFLFDFSFDKLTWMSVLNAMGFTFFSLSLGCGIMVTYGAYLKDSTDIPNSSLWIAYLAIQTALLAGLMIMPAVFAMGQDPNAGPGLVFVTIPFIFSQIPFGWFFMILFNVCLLVAALTSSVSLLEVCIAYLQNEWHMKRISASILCYVGLALLGFVSALSFGVWSDVKIFDRIIFDFLDWFCSNIMMPLGGLSIALLAGWKAWNSTYVQVNLVKKYSASANALDRKSVV